MGAEGKLKKAFKVCVSVQVMIMYDKIPLSIVGLFSGKFSVGAPREPSKAVKAGRPVQVGHDPLHHQCLLHPPQQPGQPVIFQSWPFPGTTKLKKCDLNFVT